MSKPITQTTRVVEEDHVEKCITDPPEGWVVIDRYSPHTCPWDYYGNKHTREIMLVLRNADIPSVSCNISERNLCPRGSGPKGRVRFGDDMMPGVYRVSVSADLKTDALVAIHEHKQRVHEWLHEGGDMPSELRG